MSNPDDIMYRCCRRKLRSLLLVSFGFVVVLVCSYITFLTAPQHLAEPGLQRPDPSLPLLLSLVFTDPRFPGRVRAIGAGYLTDLNVFCHFHDATGQWINASRAQVEDIQVFKLPLDGLFLSCPMPSNPFALLSFAKTRRWPGRLLFKVLRVPAHPPSSGLAVCVAPLHGSTQPEPFVAWMELNRLLGVSHFVFYNHSASSSLSKVLQHYERLGLTEMVPWDTRPLPTATEGTWPPLRTKLHYYGQFASNNDCLYRVGNRHQFIAVIDLDEILLPVSHPDLPSLLKALDFPTASQFRFLNSYVPSNFALSGVKSDPSFLRRTWRERRVLPLDKGEKVVLRFSKSLKMGVHELITSVTSATLNITWERLVQPEHGLLLHYRDPPLNLAVPDAGMPVKRLQQLLPVLRRSVKEAMNSIERRQ